MIMDGNMTSTRVMRPCFAILACAQVAAGRTYRLGLPSPSRHADTSNGTNELEDLTSRSAYGRLVGNVGGISRPHVRS